MIYKTGMRSGLVYSPRIVNYGSFSLQSAFVNKVLLKHCHANSGDLQLFL